MKQRKIRKLLAVLTAGLLAALLAVPAFPDQSSPSVIDPSKTGSLTLIKIKENSASVIESGGHPSSEIRGEGMSGICFGAVKIAEIEAVTSGDVGIWFADLDSSFSALLKDCGVTIESKKIKDKTYYSIEALETAVGRMNQASGSIPGEVKAADYVRGSSKTKHLPATDKNGKAAVSGLPLGLYLVAEEDYSGYHTDDPSGLKLSEHIHNPASPFLVSIPMTDPGDGKVSFSWNYDITVYPKDQTVRIPKYIVSEDDGDTLLQSEDLEIGETVRQVIEAGAPAVERNASNRRYEHYTVTDTMQKGLSFVNVESVRYGPLLPAPSKLSDFKSMSVMQRGKDYEVYKDAEGSVKLTDANAAGTKVFRVELLPEGLSKLNAMEYSGAVAVIFNARLTKDAEDGEGKPNKNQPSLTVKNANTRQYTIRGNEPGVYTYRVVLTKKGVSSPEMVKFSIKRKGSALSFVKEKNGFYHLSDHDTERSANVPGTEELSPAGDGTLTIRGLDAGSYEFTEKSTASGYDLLKSSFTVTLEAGRPADGMLKRAVISSDGSSSEIRVQRGTAGFEVENQKAPVLRTGGFGTKGIRICAILAGIFAILLLPVKLRKNRRDA